MAKAFGIITTSGNRKVKGLQDYRSIAGINFLGRYRIIDFAISNLSNSGIENIQVYLSGDPRSLTGHLADGRHHNINAKRGGIEILFPANDKLNSVYNTDVNFIYDNLDSLKKRHEEYVVISASCMIFTQDYDELLDKHIASGADISLLYHKVDDALAGYDFCRELTIDGDKVVDIKPSVGDTAQANISAEAYVLKKSLLIDLIKAAKDISSRYTLMNIIKAKLGELDVRAIEHTGFFAVVTDLKAYYDISLGMLEGNKVNELFSDEWPIYTHMIDSWPTEFAPTASVKNSFVCNCSKIEGTVENSVIGRNIKIGKGAVVKNSIILSYVEIGEGAVIENQIIDKYAKISAGLELKADAADPGYIKYRDVL